MTLTRVLKGVTLGLALLVCTGAMAQFNLNWYADTFFGGNIIQDSTLAPLAQGNVIYLMYAGGDGLINGLETVDIGTSGTVLGDDRVVVFEATGNSVRATVGDVDWTFPIPESKDAGEFNETANGIEQILESGAVLYAIAFDNPVGYNGTDRFLGNGYWGASGTFTTTGVLDQVWDAGAAPGWVTDQAMVPEPTTVALMIAGLAGVVAYRRKRSAA